MKLNPWVPAVLLAMFGVLFLTWSAAHSRLRHGFLYDTKPEPRNDQSAWILNGTLTPMVTMPIDARNLELVVPVNSWVAKGQVIGTADCEADAEQISQALFRLEEANAALADAKRKTGEIDTELDAARTDARSAEAAFQQVKHDLERGPVVAPADGLLIVSDVLRGTLGIASDPALLCVYTRIRQADITSLRLGQPALIAIYGQPPVNLHAKVSAIAGTPIDSPDGAAYPVTLSVEDVASKRFAGASVEIRLQTQPK